MTTREEIIEIVEKAQKQIGNRVDVGGDNPRFVLFHSGFSVCSEKVRTVLEATGIPYVSHMVNLTSPYNQNYSPPYVSLRKLAWLQLDKPPLAGEGSYEWTGSSSVAVNGLDLCVVPTLVDLYPKEGEDVLPKVVVDSEVICMYLARAAHASQSVLVPDGLEDKIEENMGLVDDMPHVAYLYDGNSVKDNRPQYLKIMADKGLMHGNQIDTLERILSEKGDKWDDEILERAYKAKLAKTQKGAEKGKSKKSQEEAAEYTKAATEKGLGVLRKVEEQLEASSTGWICNTEQPTLADYLHGVNLHRLVWLGMGNWMFDGMPLVQEYVERLFALKPLQNAVIFYPGMNPSYYTSKYFVKYKEGGKVAAFLHDRRVDEMTAMVWVLAKFK